MRQLDIFGGSQEAAQKNTRQGLFEDYKAFTDKFKPKPKLTTDDCYTPPAVYDAVLHWVRERCGLQGRNIVRPFYPSGDFERYPYEPGDVVVDNPPFSIISKIARFYADRDIPYFLFAPHLTCFNIKAAPTKVATHADIRYENGAEVKTSFISNLFPGVAVMTAPGLLRAITYAQCAARTAKPLPKYAYPANVLTITKLARLNKQGIEFQVMDTQCRHVSKLDSQSPAGKGIYGSGYLISDAKAAELKAAELKAAEEISEWPLMTHELEIIQELNKQDDEDRINKRRQHNIPQYRTRQDSKMAQIQGG